MDSAVTVEHLSCGYDDYQVLKDISFELEAGEMLGVIGPNGSGKSTLIRALTRILKLQNGRIAYYGKDIGTYSLKRLAQTVAVIPQQASIPFAFTAFELTLMGRMPHLKRFQGERPEDIEITLDAMRRTDCLQFRDRPIHELSGGERQRVIIARALAQQPGVLLLDEPTSYLDLNHQIEIFDLLHYLCSKDGMAMLCVSHDLNLAAEYCNRLMMINQGSVVASGSPDVILTAPHIKNVFGADISVFQNPNSGAPQIALKPHHTQRKPQPV